MSGLCVLSNDGGLCKGFLTAPFRGIEHTSSWAQKSLLLLKFLFICVHQALKAHKRAEILLSIFSLLGNHFNPILRTAARLPST